MNRKDFFRTLFGGAALAAGVKHMEAAPFSISSGGTLIGGSDLKIPTTSKVVEIIGNTRNLSAFSDAPLSAKDILSQIGVGVEETVEYTADIIVE